MSDGVTGGTGGVDPTSSADQTPGSSTGADPATDPAAGDPTANWPAPTGEPREVVDTPSVESRPADGPGVRRLGFPPAELEGLVELPDDVEAMGAAITGSGRPFPGAYVPLVLHDPLAAERSYDAAEWAADLIATAGGRVLAVVACAPIDPPGPPVLKPRQWNHAAAMMERVEGIGLRFGLRILARDTVGDTDVREDDAMKLDPPLAHLLDTGGYLADEHAPVQLVCPEPDDGASGADRPWELRR